MPSEDIEEGPSDLTLFMYGGAVMLVGWLAFMEEFGRKWFLETWEFWRKRLEGH